MAFKVGVGKNNCLSLRLCLASNVHIFVFCGYLRHQEITC